MWYDNDPDDGGHYRVFYGFDERKNTYHLLDPWDRDGQPRVVVYNETEFCTLWNFTETNINTTLPPYVAVALLPWRIETEFYVNSQGNITVESAVLYPNPFEGLINPKDYLVSNVQITLDVPENMKLLSDRVHSVASMIPGQRSRVKWDVLEEQTIGKVVYPTELKVRAAGVIKGSVPTVPGWYNNTVYPGYTYVDEIGGVHTRWV